MKKLLLLLMLSSFAAFPAWAAEKRVALVIGNNDYQHIEKLRNAANDSRLIAREFRALGFEVLHYENLDRKRMKSALRELVDTISGGGIGAFYFAGHGVQEGGSNYLLPVDIAALTDSSALMDEAVELGAITERLAGAKAKFSLLVIDACRNNPFPRKAGRSVGATRGLSTPNAPEGMIIIYSAGVGQQALDSVDGGANGLFTSEFAKELHTPGVHVAEMVQNVREKVKEKAAREKHEQTPAIYIQSGKVFLTPESTPALARPIDPIPSPTAPPTVAAAPVLKAPAAARPPALRQVGELAPVGPPQTVTQVAMLSPSLTPKKSASPPPLDYGVGKTFRDCADCPAMVTIPAGSFSMGSTATEAGRLDDESPQHVVGLPSAIAIGKFEIKRGEWTAFVNATGYKSGEGCSVYDKSQSAWTTSRERDWKHPGFEQTATHPAVCIAWRDVKEYLDWLSSKTGKTYRLPSEAEWEYAARATSNTARHWGNDAKLACRSANVGDRALTAYFAAWKWANHDCDDGVAFTAAAGGYAANRFGLHDMLGNAAEWTADCWHDNYTGAPNDSTAWIEGECKQYVIRGGAWTHGPWVVRAAYRDRKPAAHRSSYIGFRVARNLD